MLHFYKAQPLSGGLFMHLLHLAIAKCLPFKGDFLFIPHNHTSEMNNSNLKQGKLKSFTHPLCTIKIRKSKLNVPWETLLPIKHLT